MKKFLLVMMAVLVLALLAGCIFPHPDAMNGMDGGNTGGSSSSGGSSSGSSGGSGGSSGGGNSSGGSSGGNSGGSGGSSGGGSSGGSSGGGSTEWEEVDTGSSGGSSGSGSGGSSDTAPPPAGVDCSDAATSLIDSYVASNTNGGWWEPISAEQKGAKFEVGAYVYYRWTDDQGNEYENCTEHLFKIFVNDEGECYIGITLTRNSVDTLIETDSSTYENPCAYAMVDLINDWYSDHFGSSYTYSWDATNVSDQKYRLYVSVTVYYYDEDISSDYTHGRNDEFTLESINNECSVYDVSIGSEYAAQ